MGRRGPTEMPPLDEEDETAPTEHGRPHLGHHVARTRHAEVGRGSRSGVAMDADAASNFLLHHLQRISFLLVAFAPHACWSAHFAPLGCQGAAQAIHDADKAPPRTGYETADVSATTRLGRGMPPGAATVPLLSRDLSNSGTVIFIGAATSITKRRRR